MYFSYTEMEETEAIIISNHPPLKCHVCGSLVYVIPFFGIDKLADLKHKETAANSRN